MSFERQGGGFELQFTKAEVDLILRDPLADGVVAEQLRNAAPVPGGGFVVMATAADLEELLEAIAAAANHCETPDVVSLARLSVSYTHLTLPTLPTN